MNQQKIAFISGGNRGIGKEICRQLIQNGYAVILGSRNLEKGLEAATEMQGILGAGRKVEVCEIDLNDIESISKAAQWVENNYGRVDLLINNAGILPNADNSAHVSIATIEATFQTNLYGPLLTSQKFLPLLKLSDSPRIVNVTSGMGTYEEMGGGYTAYRLSKAAINSLSSMMAIDLKLEGVKVVAACPGWCQTDMGSPNAPRTAAEGAASIVWAATAKEAESGKIYRDGKLLGP